MLMTSLLIEAIVALESAGLTPSRRKDTAWTIASSFWCALKNCPKSTAYVDKSDMLEEWQDMLDVVCPALGVTPASGDIARALRSFPGDGIGLAKRVAQGSQGRDAAAHPHKVATLRADILQFAQHSKPDPQHH